MALPNSATLKQPSQTTIPSFIRFNRQLCSAPSNHPRHYSVASYGIISPQKNSNTTTNTVQHRKIPYRLSRPQKLRHRRRLRRVDNIVAVLDDALKRQATSSSLTHSPSPPTTTPSQPTLAPNQHIQQSGTKGKATPEELAATGEGQVILDAELNAEQEERRHGKGPKQGEMVPEFSPHGVRMPSGQFLSEEARLQGTMKLLERWKAEMPTEGEMLPRDKYTVFNRYSKVCFMLEWS